MKKTAGFISLLISAIAFGSFGIWIRFLDKEMSIYQQIVLRNAFAFVIAILIIFLTKQLKNIEWKKVKKSNLLMYSLLIPLSVIVYNISMVNTKIVLATFAYYIGAILTGWFAGILFYKEKINIEKCLSLTMVLIGLFLFAFPFNNNSINLGFVAGIISGILDGSANGFRKDLSGKISKMFLVLLTTIGGVIVSGLMIIFFHHSGSNYLNPISPTSWIIGAFFGALLVLLNYLLLIGFQNFDLSLGSIVLSLELLFALIFGIIFFKEYPSTKELFGGFFILLANIIPNLKILLSNKLFRQAKK